MELKTLSDKEPGLKIRGREDKMSAEILSVTLKDPVKENLQLIVTDENGFLLYSKPLIPEQPHPNAVLTSKFPEVAINKRFIFNNEVTIEIVSPESSPFTAEVHYV